MRYQICWRICQLAQKIDGRKFFRNSNHLASTPPSGNKNPFFSHQTITILVMPICDREGAKRMDFSTYSWWLPLRQCARTNSISPARMDFPKNLSISPSGFSVVTPHVTIIETSDILSNYFFAWFTIADFRPYIDL